MLFINVNFNFFIVSFLIGLFLLIFFFISRYFLKNIVLLKQIDKYCDMKGTDLGGRHWDYKALPLEFMMDDASFFID